jgi:hypothetical protein
MPIKSDQLHEEASALWLNLFGEPPPPEVDGAQLLEAIMNRLPELNYSRLTSAGKILDIVFPNPTNDCCRPACPPIDASVDTQDLSGLTCELLSFRTK